MNPFALAYREQQQLFLLEKSYLTGTLIKTGGLSTLIARFIVQFFWNPYVAMSLTVVLLVLSSYLLWASIRKSGKDWQALLLSIVPSVITGALISDNSLHFDYLTSLIIVECGLLIYTKLHKARIPYGILLTTILYVTAGPASIVFGLCACILEIYQQSARKYLSLSYPLIWAACGIISYLMAGTGSLYDSLSPSFHYDLDATMPSWYWIGWLSFPAVTALSGIRSKTISIAAAALIATAALAFSISTAVKLDKRAQVTGYEYEYYTVNSRWDELINSCMRHDWSPATANYLNLAAAHKGTLADELFKYDNRGVSSLLTIPEAKTVDVRVAHIMFAMGNMAASQNIAYNAMFTTEGYAPAMLKMNAQIELMRGEYKVADKYLSILEKTVRYKNWAKSQRRFLWNDELIEKDTLLNNGRKDFPIEDGFAMLENPIDELMRVVEANPADKKAMQYALSFLLLSKDIAKLQQFIDRYWGSPALQTLPVPVQEALVFYSEYSRNFEGVDPVDMDWCTSHGVTAKVIEHFAEFQKASIQSRGTAPHGYKSTYWNYLINTKI